MGREVPIVGSLVPIGLDLILWSGDTILTIVLVLASTAEAWFPLFSYLSVAASSIPLIPEEPISQMYGLVALIILLGFIVRGIPRLRSWISSRSQS